MKHAILLAAVLSTIVLTACESKEKTVITPAAAPSTIAVPVPVPGPAGPKGDAGAPGTSGSTTVIVPPAEEKKP